MNNYCSTCLGYIASDPCDGCDGTEENHIYYEPDFVRKDTKPRHIDTEELKHILNARKNTKPRYIDAEKLKRQMGLMPMDWNTRDEMWMRESDIACYIDTCPEADVVERKKGKWMGTVCSACGESCSYHFDAKYCPNCGADMRGENRWMI